MKKQRGDKARTATLPPEPKRPDTGELSEAALDKTVGGDPAPTESISLNFTKIKVDYTPQH